MALPKALQSLKQQLEDLMAVIGQEGYFSKLDNYTREIKDIVSDFEGSADRLSASIDSLQSRMLQMEKSVQGHIDTALDFSRTSRLETSDQAVARLGFDQMPIGTVLSKIPTLTPEEAFAVYLFEKARKNRITVIDALKAVMGV